MKFVPNLTVGVKQRSHCPHGLLLCFIILFSSPTSATHLSILWKNLWQTKDSQGMDLIQKKQYKEAANTFENKDWQATAAYRAGDFVKAAELYHHQGTANGWYNLGNTLAKLKQYQDAIHAYDKALALNPKDKDAIFNKALIEKLLKDNKQPPPPPQKSQSPQSDKTQSSESKTPSQPKKQEQSQEEPKPQPSAKNKQAQSAPEDKFDDKSPASMNKKHANKPQQDQQNQQQKEAEQAKSQWLKLVPEHPGGLLKQQFLRDHLRRMQGESS